MVELLRGFYMWMKQKKKDFIPTQAGLYHLECLFSSFPPIHSPAPTSSLSGDPGPQQSQHPLLKSLKVSCLCYSFMFHHICFLMSCLLFFFFKLRTLLSQVQRAGLHKTRGWVLMEGWGPLLESNEWVLWDRGDRVFAQEHLWDAVVLVDWLGFLATLGDLGPHLLQILPHVLNALTQPRSVLLFWRLMSPWVLFLTNFVSMESGPTFNSSSSHPASPPGSSASRACWGGSRWWPRPLVTTISALLWPFEDRARESPHLLLLI